MTTIHGLTHRWLEECRPSGAPSEISRVVSRRVETRGSLPAARRGRLTEAACDGVVRGARRCREHALPGGTGCRLSLSLPGTGHIVSPRKPRRNRLGPFSGDREIGIGTGLMRGTGREHRDGIEDCPLTPDPSRRNGARDAGLSRPTPRWDGTGHGTGCRLSLSLPGTGHIVSPRKSRRNRLGPFSGDGEIGIETLPSELDAGRRLESAHPAVGRDGTRCFTEKSPAKSPSRPRLLPSRNDPGQGLKSGTGLEPSGLGRD
jgi:hypothetical protein